MLAAIPNPTSSINNGILIIDDDPPSRLVVAKRLEKANYGPVRTATSGAEGLEMARLYRPILIICDWNMPSIDGLEVCRQVKSDSQLSGIYFILLTARDSVQDLVVGLEAGADEFLTKPIDHRELSARVRAGMRIADLQQQLLETVEHLEDKVADRTREIRTKNEQLLRANRIKDDFLANVSHELRTPLTSIITATRLLDMKAKEVLDDRQQQYLGIIRASSDHLKVLINDLIDFTRLDANLITIDTDEVALDFIMTKVTSIIDPVAAEKGIVFASDLPAVFAVEKLVTDENRLAQILLNLLSNAVKFTKLGGRVQFKAEVIPGFVVFEVRDTGIGIPYDLQAEVFQRFHQLEPLLTKQHGGLGVGLSLSAELAQLLGGHILFCSEVGVGSTFRLYLPRVN
ncbi:MAG: response regulator [Gemmatimonadaceae bacterium]|nr:response regulator [Gloeobacterales cyanobacterium ES-bin-141]